LDFHWKKSITFRGLSNPDRRNLAKQASLKNLGKSFIAGAQRQKEKR